MQTFFFFIVLLLVAGLLALWLARRRREESGLPIGEVVYSDTGAEEAVERPLLSRRYGLVGKPDYLVLLTYAGEEVRIPVEVKSRKRPTTLYQNHALQLGAYCLLVEDVYGVTPPYGLLRYADGTFQVAFTLSLRNQVLEAIQSIQNLRQQDDVHRNHQVPQRCVDCGYRHACGEEM